jgi:hypothetical protein
MKSETSADVDPMTGRPLTAGQKRRITKRRKAAALAALANLDGARQDMSDEGIQAGIAELKSALFSSNGASNG